MISVAILVETTTPAVAFNDGHDSPSVLLTIEHGQRAGAGFVCWPCANYFLVQSISLCQLFPCDY